MWWVCRNVVVAHGEQGHRSIIKGPKDLRCLSAKAKTEEEEEARFAREGMGSRL